MFVLKEIRRGLRSEVQWNKLSQSKTPPTANPPVKRKFLKEFSAAKKLQWGKCYADVIQEGNRFQLKWLNLAVLAR